MNISAYFIRNPIIASLLFTILTLTGIYGFNKMTIKLFPDVEVPFIVVTIPVPGSSPTQLESEVARKLEPRLGNIEGAKNVFSTLVDNTATIVTEFDIDKPSDEAMEDVRAAVSEAQGSFPSNAKTPILSKPNANPNPLFIYSITSSNLDIVDLSWYVENELDKELLSVKGVAEVIRVGGVEREVQVLLDPTVLKSYNTSVSYVSSQVTSMQKNFSGGETYFGGLTQPVRTIAAVQKTSDLNDLRITMVNGQVVKLSDIAIIKDTFAEQKSKAILDGQEGVAFIVKRAKGFGDLEVGKAVRKKIDEIRKANSHLAITEVFETYSIVDQDYSGAMMMLIEGSALAVLVVLIFLGGLRPSLYFIVGAVFAYYFYTTVPGVLGIVLAGIVVLIPVVIFFDDFRATIIAATALPLSMLPAFAGMYFMGITFNVMVTLALSLAIGILVDDAIVEVENIDQHINMGKDPYTASIEAADEIGMAVIAITMALIAVFLPTAFMPGVAGKFFYQFGLAASFAIFASLLVARIITPMMCAYLLTPKKHLHKEPLWLKPYLWFANWAIRLRWITIIAAFGFFAYSVMEMKKLPQEFIPPNDADSTMIKIELPPGGKIDKTEKVARKVVESIKDVPYIKNAFARVGSKYEARMATIYITLVERKERPDMKRTDIENLIRNQLDKIPGARFSITSGANGEVYQMTLSSSDNKALREASEAITTELRTIPELGNVTNSSGLTRQELIIYPDYTKAADRGVSSASIANEIRVATVGDFKSRLSKLNSDERQIPIVIRLPDVARSDISMLNDLMVMGSKGLVRVGDVAKVDVDQGILEIRRKNRSRYEDLKIEIKSGGMGDIKEKVSNLPAMKNLPKSVKEMPAGELESMQELGVSFAIAISVAIICIYFVMVVLFGQFAQPITILAALSLAIGGAVYALKIYNFGLSLPAMIGFLMLMGIAVKNSILLVEYIIDKRKTDKNVSRHDAVMEACRKRARPIIMTTIAMGAGMLPLILGLGEADPSFRRPMALAVFGGLITSTILSLIVIPAFYTVMDDATKVVAWIFRFGRPIKPSRKEIAESIAKQ